MNLPPLAVDVAIAVVAAVVLLIVAPGVAMVAIVAAIVLLLCGLSLLIDRRRDRRAIRAPRATRSARGNGSARRLR